jgi:WD40 repeat protein
MTRGSSSCLAGVLVCLAAAGALGQAPSAAAPAATVTLPADATSLIALNRSASVAAGLADGQVALWNGRDAAPASVFKPHTARVLAVGSTADGAGVWSVASDGSLARTPVAPGSKPAMQRVDLGAAAARAAAFSADGAMLVTGDEFGELRVFNTSSGALKHRLRGHRTELHFIAVRPGSTIVATASAEADLRIWDAAAGREISSVDNDLAFFALGFSPVDGTLASGGVDRRMTLRKADTFKPVGEMTLPPHRMVATLAWSPSGRYIAVGDLDDETLSKGGVQVIEAASRALLATLDTGGTPVGGLVFANQGTVVIASVGRDLRAWTVPAVK